MEKNKCFGDREGGRVIAGIILIAVGAAFLLRYTLDIPKELFSWPVVLILVGIYVGFKHKFKNNSWLIFIAVGGFFLVNKFYPDWKLFEQYWPVIIIGLGLIFILRPGRSRWMKDKTIAEYNDWENLPDTPIKDPANAPILESSDYLNVRSVFSGVNKNVVSKNFQGGVVSCVFGGSEIDLSQADINGRVTIKLDIVFGGVELVVPPHWIVQNDIDGFFHGLEDKRKFNPSATNSPEKMLILKGSVVFGGIEVKNY